MLVAHIHGKVIVRVRHVAKIPRIHARRVCFVADARVGHTAQNGQTTLSDSHKAKVLEIQEAGAFFRLNVKR